MSKIRKKKTKMCENVEKWSIKCRKFDNEKGSLENLLIILVRKVLALVGWCLI